MTRTFTAVITIEEYSEYPTMLTEEDVKDIIQRELDDEGKQVLVVVVEEKK